MTLWNDFIKRQASLALAVLLVLLAAGLSFGVAGPAIADEEMTGVEMADDEQGVRLVEEPAPAAAPVVLSTVVLTIPTSFSETVNICSQPYNPICAWAIKDVKVVFYPDGVARTTITPPAGAQTATVHVQVPNSGGLEGLHAPCAAPPGTTGAYVSVGSQTLIHAATGVFTNGAECYGMLANQSWITSYPLTGSLPVTLAVGTMMSTTWDLRVQVVITYHGTPTRPTPIYLGIQAENLNSTYCMHNVSPHGLAAQHMQLYNNGQAVPAPVQWMQSVLRLGMTPLLTIEPWDPVFPDSITLDKLVQGLYDQRLADLAVALRGIRSPVIVRWAPEFQPPPPDAAPWFPWQGGSADTYKQAWIRVWGIFQANGATNVRWLWSPNREPLDNYAPYYPGDAYVDYVGTSGFVWGNKACWTATPDCPDFDALFGAMLTDLATRYPMKTQIIAEWGIADDSIWKPGAAAGCGKAELLQRSFSQMAKYPILDSAVYFAISKTECMTEPRTIDWRPWDAPLCQAATATCPTCRAAYQTAVNNPVFSHKAPLAVPMYVQRVNAGGGVYTDTTGKVWAADQRFALGQWGYTNANAGTFTITQPIAGTLDDYLYQTERNAMVEYRFTIPVGVFTVNMKFSENRTAAGVGWRVFDIKPEGATRPLLTNLDIFALAGAHFKAVDRSFSIAVNDGVLNLQFIAKTRQPKVGAIRVQQTQ